MASFEGLRLFPYYLNTRRLAELTGANIPVVAQESLLRNSSERAKAMRSASEIANGVLQSGELPNLNKVEAEAEDDLDGKRQLGVIWGLFSFRGLSDALARERLGKPAKPGTFTGVIPLGEREYTLSGQLSNDHLYSSTSVSQLRGRKRMLLAGLFEFKSSLVEVHPLIIGDMVEDFGDRLPIQYSSSVRLYPQEIDTFQRLKTASRQKKKNLKSFLQCLRTA